MPKTKQREYAILVVDDEPSVLLTYRLILEDQGYKPVAVATFREAKGHVEKQQFDLILCDLSLEEKHTGFELIALARQRNPKVPCVLLTGYASKEAMDKADSEKIEVLFKPIEIQELLTTIPRILKTHYEEAKASGE